MPTLLSGVDACEKREGGKKFYRITFKARTLSGKRKPTRELLDFGAFCNVTYYKALAQFNAYWGKRKEKIVRLIKA